MNSGRDAELEIRARELLNQRPNEGPLWQLLGVALTRQGKDALQALQVASRLMPKDAAAHNNLGNALGRLGRLDEAVASYRHALLLNPQFAEAHNNLGHALLDLGEPEAAAASLHCAILHRPRYAEAHDNRGTALLELGRAGEAALSYRRAIEIEPTFAEAHSNLGNALLELGRLEEALGSYRHALKINPELAEAHNNLGNALRGLGRLDEAEASYRRAVGTNPNFAAAHCNLASVQRLQGRVAEAQASCRAALDLDPQSPEPYVILAESSADQGDFAAARQLFELATEVAPEAPEAWAGMARISKMSADDAPWLAQALRIAERRLPARQEIGLRYAIGKYFDDVGDFEQAFRNFRRANELTKLRRAAYDAKRLTSIVDLIVRAYDQDWVNRHRCSSMESARPVFIVGMLRSGTSLAEQILASHADVFGAGELPFWGSALEVHQTSALGAEESDTVLPRLGGEYLHLLQKLSHDALRVVDKMPTNFPYLGLIHAALPNSRIIHLQRNPADTCVSIYFQHLETAVPYANDFEDLAHYYGEYLRLMTHWRSILPERLMLEVPYEGLVADPEAWSRRMVEFIGLPWDARCLDFHKTKRAVITASKWQVRQAITTSSVERWRHYEKYLGPLLRHLGGPAQLNAAPAARLSCE